MRVRNRMSRRRALDVRRNDAHLAILAGHLREDTNAWAVDAVIVRDQDAHADPACKEPAANGPALELGSAQRCSCRFHSFITRRPAMEAPMTRSGSCSPAMVILSFNW